jgi:gliding motility-associated-like protein
MKKSLLYFFIFLSINVFSQTTDWVKSFGGTASDKGISIGTDSLGFIYCSGYFNNEATFGNITLTNNNLSTSGNNKENFIFKMDSVGDVIWAVAGGNLSGSCCDDRALGMHVTPGGDVFITGTFWSSYYIGSCQVQNGPFGTGINSADNSLLAKLDKDGNCVWAIGFGADDGGSGAPCPSGVYDEDDHSYDVKVDDDGFIYVTGFFSGVGADFDGLSITNPHWNIDCQPMGYIGKLDPNGNWLWVESFDGVKDQRGSRDNRLAIDQFSNIYVVGGFQNTGVYGPFSITSNGEWDAFIFKMDKDGNWIWAEGFGSNKTDRANGIAVDVCGDIYITGEYRNPMVFSGANASNGTDILSHKQKRDIFVAKMNNQGEWKWAKRARGPGTDKPYQMSVNANKQVFLGGTTKDTLVFSNSLSVAPQIAGDVTASSWVAQLDGSTSTGDWVWAKLAGSDTDDDDRTGDICPDGFGNVYAIGFFEELANFDGTILDATGRRKDIFVWKMSMTPGSFTYNNTSETFLRDSMVFNPADTGVFTTSFLVIDGCDTAFVDSVVHQKLGVQINFNINNPGTATFTINGVIQAMPYSQNYWAGETINIEATLQASWLFSQWMTYANNVSPTITSVIASFVANVSDSCVLYTHPQPPLSAFISGNDSVCLNASYDAQVSIAFNGAVSPYTLVYAIDGISQPSITTTVNPYIINTKQEGVYTLLSFNDAIAIGWVSGSALVTVRQSPTANFEPQPDSMTIIYTTTQLIDKSVVDASVNIVSWNWNFGDNTPADSARNPYHTYKDSVGIYQISLIVMDNLGCSDTTYKQLWVLDDYWMYIPNSFTPDLDGINDVFCIQYHGVRKETFYFNVYDRFSTLVYTTSNITDLECELNSNAWDGTHYLSKKELPLGSYIYEMYFQDFEGWKHQESGHIIIVR